MVRPTLARRHDILIFASLLLLSGAVDAQLPDASDDRSVPVEATRDTAAAPAGRAAAPLAGDDEAQAPSIGGIATVGLNAEISRLFEPTRGSGFIPPDTMGAVGPRHIVEMINGNWEVVDKTTGASINSRSLDNFWTAVVGLGIVNNGRFDPRIIYDAASERWFAVSIDNVIDADNDNNNEAANNVFVARSDTDDPTGDWDGFSFNADSVGALEFHDYPTLGVDADGLYICTQDFDGGGNESCYSIPKADLLLAAPTAANLTRFEATPAGLPATSGSWQIAVNSGLSNGRAALLGSTGTALQRTSIFGASAGGAFLGAAVAIAGDPGHAAPPAARQPQDSDAGDTEDLENVAPRFVGNVVVLGDRLWAAHAVEGPAAGANSAIRWYEINEGTNTVVQTGIIENTDVDFHEPSIAVNPSGNVVIGYTCSGRNLAASVCASVGQTAAGVTTFQPPAILFAGAGTYYRDFCTPPGCSERNRWGDYSATVVDPSDPCTFWTFQEYTAQDAGNVDLGPGEAEGGLWGVRVVEITFPGCNGPDSADLALTKLCKPDTPLVTGQSGFCEINVTNFGPGSALNVSVVDRFLSNGTFTLSNITTTKGTCSLSPDPQTVTCQLGRLALNDTVLIRVQVSATTAQTVNNVATVSSDTPDPYSENNRDEDGLTFTEPNADLSLTKVCTPNGGVPAGSTATCTITVHNFGPAAAQTLTVVDAHTSTGTFTFGAVAASAGACVTTPNPQVMTGTVTCTLASLASGADLVITVPLSATTPQDVNDTATVDAATPDPETANNIADDTVSFTGLADLSISKTDSPDPVVAGTNLTYSFTVANAGPSEAVNVVVSDLLPSTVSVVSVSASGGGNCNAGVPGTVATSCTFSSIASGANRTMTLVVRVHASVPAGTILSNNASVSSDTADTNNLNDLATTTTEVIASADLGVSKADSPDPVVAGGTITYTMTVTNAGPSWARDVTLSDTLPAAVTFGSAAIGGGTGVCVPLAGVPTVVSCSLGDVADGGVRVVTIQGTVAAATPDGAILSNTATVSASTPDPAAGNDSDTEQTAVVTRADIWIDKTGVELTGNPSRTIRFTLAVYNRPGCEADDALSCGDGGPSDAQNVVVTDTLPLDPKKMKVVFTSQNCSYNQGAHQVVCQVAGALPVGQVATFIIDVQLAGSVGTFTNNVSVTASTTDPNAANNTDQLQMIVKGGSGRPR